jgi:hypothetical protein
MFAEIQVQESSEVGKVGLKIGMLIRISDNN